MARLRATPARAARSTANSLSLDEVTTPSELPAAPAAETEETKTPAVFRPSPKKGSLRRPRNYTQVPSATAPTLSVEYPSLDAEQVTEATIAISSQHLCPQLSNETPKKRKIPVPVTVSVVQRTVPLNDTRSQSQSSDTALPAIQNFEFKFSPGLEEQGKKILEELQVTSAAVRATMPITPPNKGIISTAATTGRRRFSSVHKRNFDKMDSIANHYAAKRTTPRPAVQTPQNPQKGIKRTKSQISIDKGHTPTSPSPVKKNPSVQPEEGGRVKRIKLDTPAQTKMPNRISKSSATPLSKLAAPKSKIPTTSSGTSLVSRFAALKNKRKPMPALPRLADQKDKNTQQHSKLVLDDCPVGMSSSRIPVTPRKSEVVMTRTPNTARKLFAPNTIAAPKVSLPPLGSSARPIKRATGPSQPQKSSPGTFTFSANTPGTGFKRLSDMRAFSLDKAPAKLSIFGPNYTETTDLEDPFSPLHKSPRRETRIWSPIAVEQTPQRLISPNKRKELDSPSQPPVSPNKRKELDSTPTKDDSGRDEPIEEPPAAKRLRFDLADSKTASPASNESRVRATPTPLKKSRLDFLATPKRLMNKALGRTGRKGTGKPLWK